MFPNLCLTPNDPGFLVSLRVNAQILRLETEPGLTSGSSDTSSLIPLSWPFLLCSLHFSRAETVLPVEPMGFSASLRWRFGMKAPKCHKHQLTGHWIQTFRKVEGMVLTWSSRSSNSYHTVPPLQVHVNQTWPGVPQKPSFFFYLPLYSHFLNYSICKMFKLNAQINAM